MLKDNTLALMGTVSPKIYNNLSPPYTECKVGNSFKQFALNEDIDDSRIQARMQNGALEVELPKREHAKPRKIEVQMG